MKEFYFVFNVKKENVKAREAMDFLGLSREFSCNEAEGIARIKIRVNNNIDMEELIDKLEKYYSVNGYKYICIGIIPLGEINVC